MNFRITFALLPVLLGSQFCHGQLVDTGIKYDGKDRLLVTVECTPKSNESSAIVADTITTGDFKDRCGLYLGVKDKRIVFWCARKIGLLTASKPIVPGHRYKIEASIDGRKLTLKIDGEIEGFVNMTREIYPSKLNLFIGADPDDDDPTKSSRPFDGHIHSAKIEIGNEQKLNLQFPK